MKNLLLLISFLLCASIGQSQLVVENTQTVEWYVQNVLLGGGVTAQNVTFNGAPANQVEVQCGFFNSATANVGLTEGIILSSGNVVDATGPNDSGGSGADLSNPGDLDLDDLSLFGTFDAAVLEFDFIPQGDSLSFNFVFGSEEYPEYANDVFNDVFGFFLAGPGIVGPYSSPGAFPGGSANIAIIPGTTIPVAINNINNGNANTGPCENCAFYVDNGDGATAPFDTDDQYIQYDGLTVPMTAMAEVECGETYHIKIVLADAGDGAFDSGVFLEAGSFSANQVIQVDLEFDIQSSFASNTLFEGCFIGTLLFERFSGITNQSAVELLVTGSAQNGIDYTTIPQFITFQPGDTLVELEIQALIDGLVEGTETVTIEVINNQNLCGTNTPSIFTFDIADSAPDLQLPGQTFNIDCNESVDLSSVATGGLGLYQYVWNDGTPGNMLTVSPDVTTTYTLIASDTCVTQNANADFVVNVATYPALDLQLPLGYTLECGNNDTIVSPIAVTGGSQPLIYEWFLDGVPAGNATTLPVSLVTSSVVNLTITDQCGSSTNETALLNVVPYTPPTIDLQADYFTNCLDTDATIVPLSVTGGQGAIIYTWSQNGAVTAPSANQLTVSTSLDEQQVAVQVTITDECNSVFSDESMVTYVPAPPVNISLPTEVVLICDDPAVLLSPNSVTGGQGDLTYQWFTGGQPLSSTYDLETSTNVPTSYTFEVTDECGYAYEEDVPVIIDLYEYMSIETFGDTSVCPGDLITLEAGVSGGLAPISYQWNNSLANAAAVQAAPQESTNYAVTATDVCGNQIAGSISAFVTEVHAGFNLHMEDYHGFYTDNISWHELSDSLTYTWYVDGEEIAQQFEVSMQFADMDDHVVSLLMVNEAGCKDSIYHFTQAPPTLFVPSAFTPDGDGLNDQFRVQGNNISKYEIKIYDRWGTVVFASENMEEAWLGEGRPGGSYYSDPDIYAYRIIAEGPGGNYFEYEGHITLIR
jgi:gliding motility-associated-like protein